MEEKAVDLTSGSHLSVDELHRLGVTRDKDEYGNSMYRVPCVVCGAPMGVRKFSTERVYKCQLCKKGLAKRRKEIVEAAREEVLGILAEDLGTDYAHLKRFERATTKFDKAYNEDIESARKAIGKFDSVPEAIACIELLHTGARVIAHQKVGNFTVDFCLPDEKVIVEVDGGLYHSNSAKEQLRDHAISYMLEGDWEIRHIPAVAVAKNHKAFGQGMKRMLNARRRDMGITPL